ncbi:MAG: hypothetical protein WBA28_06515 [Microbacteriaceae bacterium]
MIRSKFPRPFLLSGVVLSALILAGCASDPPNELPPTSTETPTETTQETQKPEETVAPKEWDTMSVEERCKIVLDQIPEASADDLIPLSEFMLAEPLSGSLTPDCLIKMESGSLPKQMSIYLNGNVGLKDEIVRALGTISFFPFSNSATLASLQSQEIPGNMLVEHWEAGALLANSQAVKDINLDGKIIVILTAIYDPNFDPELLNQNNG